MKEVYAATGSAEELCHGLLGQTVCCGRLSAGSAAVPVVDLPLGHRRPVWDARNERALGEGVKAFAPGLLRAREPWLSYIDEVICSTITRGAFARSAAQAARVEREGFGYAPAVLAGRIRNPNKESAPQCWTVSALY